MFTGIVAAVGKITAIEPQGAGPNDGVRLVIDAAELQMADVGLGDSISLNGACMTVTSKSAHGFTVDVSRESLNCTVGLDAIGEVNLEKALTLTERLGGHLVSGHVDGLGLVTKFEPVGESWELVIQASRDLAKYFAYKGSIVVNGVSLTVNRIEDTTDACLFSINLIPHTIQVTTLRHLAVGKQVNLEVDLIARYVERMLSESAK
ncbi:riboflavin synthase [Glaciimonas immobilis]|uniref:Riboflavin synthase n=1 Tax=Glaciimonas immobilis TaxID=728004 RepID=A0A840RZK1_9BURK|nr:riboflavin synthase [Glaciimonas immobilis]KAF3996080.1 riboflavin synthase [Glaciimonas immobilis]MBB5201779.1 riboflavin synthase [Glaciimonas immobilis]